MSNNKVVIKLKAQPFRKPFINTLEISKDLFNKNDKALKNKTLFGFTILDLFYDLDKNVTYYLVEGEKFISGNKYHYNSYINNGDKYRVLKPRYLYNKEEFVFINTGDFFDATEFPVNWKDE